MVFAPSFFDCCGLFAEMSKAKSKQADILNPQCTFVVIHVLYLQVGVEKVTSKLTRLKLSTCS